MNRFARCFTLSLSLALAGTVLALPGDRDLPVKVSADRNRGNLATNEMVYSGDVRIEQGTLTIVGEEVRIFRNEGGEISRMEARDEEGAWVSDQFEEGDPFTRLDGETVIYDSEAGFITAQGSASLQQGRNLVTAHYIRYELDTEQFESDVRAPDGSTGDRVNMCLIRDSDRENPDGETTQRPTSC